MVKVFPFKGITYNEENIKKFDKVFAPPYDIISPEQQETLYNQHDFNFVRLILGKGFPEDTKYNNKYVRAAAFLEGWLRHQIMIQADKPAFYIYEQRFTCNRKTYTRLGFFGLIRLEEMGRGKVFPHEETYPKAKLDRLDLMRATFANLDSVFSFYDDEKLRVTRILKSFMKRKPLIDIKDHDGVRNRLWVVDRKPALARIMQEMKDKAVFIADGHHRYEAANRFKTELKIKNTKFTEEESYNHVLMYFTPIEDKGLLVLPIHRVVNQLAFFDPMNFVKQLEQYFLVTPYKASKRTAPAVLKKLLKDMEKKGLSGHAIGLYLGKDRYYLLVLKDENVVDELCPEDKPKAWKRLDATILHYVVFDRILGIAQQTEDKVVYFKEAEGAVKKVDDNGAQIAFLLNPCKLEEITSIASKLEKMPHKTTYFYPKLLSGLVLNKIVHGEKIKS